jgi:DNA-binding beta-propeller fold protein YncE
VFDSSGLLYVNTDTEDAVIVFDPVGERVRAFGTELAGGLHGMCLVERDGRERLWLAHTGRHEVLQVTLDGEPVHTIPWPEASGHYESADGYRPTGVAEAPDGTLFVTDGYGAGWVHRFDSEGAYLSSFGGPGDESGRFRTPHGVWVDTRRAPPTVLVADRENGRLQRFTLEGEHLEVLEVELLRPCQVKECGGFLVVADLAGRVTILDEEGGLVAHLGDQPDEALRARNDVGRELWREGEFLSPHCARWDSRGDLYVMDWNAAGRVSKLERVR